LFLNDWLNNDFKHLILKSAYGTGKTTCIKEILKDNRFERVLFLTYRKSITTSFYKELSELKFKSYLHTEEFEQDKIYKENKIIIQLDSINKLKITDKYKYDLIIIDEIEGILNHLSYEKINQYVIFNQLKSLIEKAKSTISMDGDSSERTYDFISYFNEPYKIYENKYFTSSKNFNFTKNIEYFEKQIDDDLNNNLNICIVSMTAAETNKYYEKYNQKYKVIIHNSVIKNKEILSDVNNEWNKCQLLIYSPSVEAGIDFNK